MGWFSGNGKEGTFIEGTKDSAHTHRDGTFGSNVRADKVSYKEGKEVGRTDAGWGHEKSRDNDYPTE